MLTRADPTLDRPMILFQYIVEILHRSMLAILHQSALGFELYDGWRVSGVLVGVDDPRVRMVRTSQGFGQKALAGRCIAFGREQEVDCRTAGVHGPIAAAVQEIGFHAGDIIVREGESGNWMKLESKGRWWLLRRSVALQKITRDVQNHYRVLIRMVLKEAVEIGPFQRK